MSKTHTHANLGEANAPLLTLKEVGLCVSHEHSLSAHLTQDAQNKVNHLGQKVLLSDISMQILPFELVSVIGPNGAGKSTLMKVILGLLEPTTGEVHRHDDLRIGYVPQKFSVPSILPLRVKDLLAQALPKPSLLAGLSPLFHVGKTQVSKTHVGKTQHPASCTPEQTAQLFDRLSIEPLLGRQVNQLSGGETQRVLLARSLLSKPNLLILDEPMQGLDPESERWLYAFIDDLPEFLRCAMLVVSHDLHWVMRGTRRVICLNKHICCAGKPSEIELSPEFIRLFGHQFETPYVHQHYRCQHEM